MSTFDSSAQIYEIHTDSSGAGGPGDYIVIKNLHSSDISLTDISINLGYATGPNDGNNLFCGPNIDIPAGGYWLGFDDVSKSFTFDSNYIFDTSKNDTAALSFNLSDHSNNDISLNLFYKGVKQHETVFTGGYEYAQRFPDPSENDNKITTDVSYAFHLRLKDADFNVIDLSRNGMLAQARFLEPAYKKVGGSSTDISHIEFGSDYIHQFVGLGNSAKYMADISNDTSSNYYLRHDASNNPGHVFELVDLDISNEITANPSFAQAVQYIEGISADCVAEFVVPLSYWNKFFVARIDSIDVSDEIFPDSGTTDISQDIVIGLSGESAAGTANSYGDDTLNQGGTLFRDISYSNAIVIVDAIKPSDICYEDQSVQYDYVRHLSKEITGGYAAVDLFRNEYDLRRAVEQGNDDIKVKLETILKNLFKHGDPSYGLVDGRDVSYCDSSNNLYRPLLNLFKLNLNTTDSTRYQNQDSIFTYISNANTFYEASHAGGNARPYKIIPIQFTHNDRVAIKVTYHQQDVNPIGTNHIQPRSYKILLRMDENMAEWT